MDYEQTPDSRQTTTSVSDSEPSMVTPQKSAHYPDPLSIQEDDMDSAPTFKHGDEHEFELAIDAVAMAGNNSLSVPLQYPHDSTTSSGEMFELQSPDESKLVPSKPCPPSRPPPIRPHPPARVLAASDIHALLDSFPNTANKESPFNDMEPTKSDSNIAGMASTCEETEYIQSLKEYGGESDASVSLECSVRSRNGVNSSVSCTNKVVHPSETSMKHLESAETRTGRRRYANGSRKSRARRASDQKRSTLGLKVFLSMFAVFLLACLYFFSSFALGIFIGVAGTVAVLRIKTFLCSESSHLPKCHISGLPLGELCCSMHCHPNSQDNRRQYWPVYAPALPPLRAGFPLLRDLQTFSVPHMHDEDPSSSTSTGPLGSSLGFKLDKNEHPIYTGWMNETSSYDPETHHVNRTNSVYVTLEGTQLRLQRPKRNVARRSMWNEELPSMASIRFQTQRAFDLTHAQVVLLPAGLVCKRLWSKKYPISITFTAQTGDKESILNSTRKAVLPSSTSAPNIESLQAGNAPNKHDSPSRQSSVDASAATPEDSFFVVPKETPCVVLFLFGRTCREKEAWYRRFRAASLGVPFFWTPQLAVQSFLSSSTSINPRSGDSRSDDEVRSEPGVVTSDLGPADASVNSSETKPTLNLPTHFTTPISREPIYVTYVRYMAKFMPATWLMRGAQALQLNMNYVTCDNSLAWLNALLARMFWDFLREAYWLERVKEKIQAKLKKIHLPPFISDLLVVGIDLGTELPVIRHIGRPHLDAHGLWFELDVAYAGGFSVALETNVNLMRWNQRSRVEWEAANVADDVSLDTAAPTVSISPEPSLIRRTSRMGAFISDEEDSADSTTDSDTASDIRPPTLNSARRSSGPVRSTVTANQTASATASGRPLEEERSSSGDRSPATSSTSSASFSFQLPSGLPSRKRLIRIMDRITKSSYFQKAVDNKLVQRGMEILSNTPIVLEAEIQTLNGTLLVNIPPPPSDRLWYGFRPNPQLRIKARPRVGEKAVTMSRILEWIEKRVALEFQRVVVLPNMDDITIPLLLSDVVAGGTK